MKLTDDWQNWPIQLLKEQTKKGGWSKWERTPAKIKDLFECFNIDDPSDEAELTQVLRLIRDYFEQQKPKAEKKKQELSKREYWEKFIFEGDESISEVEKDQEFELWSEENWSHCSRCGYWDSTPCICYAR